MEGVLTSHYSVRFGTLRQLASQFSARLRGRIVSDDASARPTAPWIGSFPLFPSRPRDVKNNLPEAPEPEGVDPDASMAAGAIQILAEEMERLQIRQGSLLDLWLLLAHRRHGHHHDVQASQALQIAAFDHEPVQVTRDQLQVTQRADVAQSLNQLHHQQAQRIGSMLDGSIPNSFGLANRV